MNASVKPACISTYQSSFIREIVAFSPAKKPSIARATPAIRGASVASHEATCSASRKVADTRPANHATAAPPISNPRSTTAHRVMAA
jgi:hypothetical protein